MGLNVFAAAYVEFQMGTGSKSGTPADQVKNTAAIYEYGQKGREGLDTNNNGFKEVDCSSLVWRGLKDAGYDVPIKPFTTRDLFNGDQVTSSTKEKFDVISKNDARESNGSLKPGDIFMWRTSKATGQDKNGDPTYGQHIGVFTHYDKNGNAVFYGAQSSTGPAFATVVEGKTWNGKDFTIVGALRPKESTYSSERDKTIDKTATSESQKGFLDQVTEGVRQANEATIAAIQKVINDALDAAKEAAAAADSMTEEARQAITDALNEVARVANDKLDSIDRSVTDLQDRLQDTFSEIGSAVSSLSDSVGIEFVQFVDGISKTLEDFGKEVSGYAEVIEAAITSVLDDLANRISGFGGDVKQWLEQLADPRSAPPTRRDPLILDLDSNGIQTTAATTNTIHFDHDANSFAESTGWLNRDDAFLAMDRNGNGTIDSGLELFGDQTTLRSGAKASNGLQALGEWDTNKDGQITAADTRYNDLRVWRDLNQDGVSQTNELQTLPESGIASISLVGTATDAAADANGNTLTRTGSFTRTDTSTGLAGEIAFKRDTALSIPVATYTVSDSIAAQPDLSGYGNLLDLHQAVAKEAAANEATPLATALSAWLTAPTVGAGDTAARDLALDTLLYTWANAAGVPPASRGTAMDARQITFLETAFGQSLGNPSSNAAIQWTMSWQQVRDYYGASLLAQTSLKPLFDEIQYTWDDASRTLKADLSSVVSLLQDSLASDAVNGTTTGTAQLADFARAIKGLGAQDSVNYHALRETFVELDQRNGTELAWAMDSAGMKVYDRTGMGSRGLTPHIEGTDGSDAVRGSLVSGDHYINGLYGSDTIWGTTRDEILINEAGDSLLHGAGGSDTLLAGAGDDILDGGTGNDILQGEAGNDTYVFRKGSGIDRIKGWNTGDKVWLASNKEGLAVTRSNDDLVIGFTDTSDQLIVENYYAVAPGDPGQQRAVIAFRDGATWTDSDITAGFGEQIGTAGTDLMTGSPAAERLDGRAGNDRLIGNGGNDTLIGGTGDDTLYGAGDILGASSVAPTRGANGDDTYIYRAGDGKDTIIDLDPTLNTDTLKLEGIAPEQVSLHLSFAANVQGTADLVLDFANGGQVTVKEFVDTRGPAAGTIERFVFDDGTVWTDADLRSHLFAGTPGNDTLNGYGDADLISGGEGNDLIAGNPGNDTLDGGAGDDRLLGGLGDDVLLGGDGTDVLAGHAGNDTFDGGAGDDIVFGNGEQNLTYLDYASAAANGNDTYRFGRGSGHDVIVDRDATQGNRDVIQMAADVDAASLRLQRSGSDLVLVIPDTADSLTIRNWFKDGSREWRVEGIAFGDGTLWNEADILANTAVVGTTGNDVVNGLEFLDDTLLGLTGDDVLMGRGGNDTLEGGAGRDLLYGGEQGVTTTAGNDVYRFGWGDGLDTAIDTDGGIDQVEFKTGVRPEDVSVRRSGDDLILGLSNTDALTLKDWAKGGQAGIETVRFADQGEWDVAELKRRAVVGSSGDDVLNGFDQDETLNGGAGNDTLAGGAGNDTYVFRMGDGVDTVVDVQGVDTLVMADIASTAAMARRTGNDLVLRIDGGDQVSLRDWFAVEGATSGVQTVQFANGVTWDAVLLRQLVLQGTTGADELTGYSGIDVLDGGRGNDVLTGGGGADTYIFRRGDGADTVIERDTANTQGVDTLLLPDLTSGEISLGSNGTDMILWVKVDPANSMRFRNWFSSPDSRVEQIVFADNSVWTAAQIAANVSGSSPGNDTMSGTTAANLLDGGDGNDTLYGLAGDDVLLGGVGDDNLYGGNYVPENRYSFVPQTGTGNDILIGGPGNDTIYGGDGVNEYRYNLGDGVDTILTVLNWPGKTTAVQDVLVFGAGITPDMLSIQYSRGGAPVFLSSDEGFARIPPSLAISVGGDQGVVFNVSRGQWPDLDEVFQSGNGDWIGPTVALQKVRFDDGTELSLQGLIDRADAGVPGYQTGNGYLAGSFAADTIMGSGVADQIVGRGGNDSLFGNGGGDVISGGAGDDLISGDIGNDFLNGGAGNDTLWAGDGDDVIGYNRGHGTDTVYSYSPSYTNQSPVTSNVDTISFGGGIRPEHVTVRADGQGNLVLETGVAGDTLTLAKAAVSALLRFRWMQFIDEKGNGRVFDVQASWSNMTQATPLLSVATEVTGTRPLAGGDSALAAAFYGTPIAPATPPNPDLVSGSALADVLNVVGNNQRVEAGAGNDIINVHQGVQMVDGGAGNDVYHFWRGSHLTIVEQQESDSANQIVLEDVAFADIGVAVDERGVLLQVANGGGEIRIENSSQLASRALISSVVSRIDSLNLSWQQVLDRGFSEAGGENGDTLTGGAGNDLLSGQGGDDVLQGGKGADRLDGGAGDDTYLFNAGDGVDTIIDSSSAQAPNTIRFGAGIAPWNLVPALENGVVVLRIGANGDKLRFEGVNPSATRDAHPVERFVFANGSELSWNDVLAAGFDIAGTNGDDTLTGTDHDDRLRGYGGNDTIAGGAGADAYFYQPDSGARLRIEDQTAPGEENSLAFGTRTNGDSLSLHVENGELVLRDNYQNDAITLGATDRAALLETPTISNFSFADGSQLGFAELVARGIVIDGTDESDLLVGTVARDVISGGAGNDRIEGGQGGDLAVGGAGDDSYVFNRGDGELVIDDVALEGEGNTLQFGPGITLDDMRNSLRFSYDATSRQGEFIIRLGDSGDRVRIAGFDPADAEYGSHGVEYFQFSDGSTFNFRQMVRNTFVVQGDTGDDQLTGTSVGDRLYGYEGADTLEGGQGSDVLTGGTGDDLLIGGEGSNTYILDVGDGNDEVVDPGEATLVFGPGVQTDAITYTQEAEGLRVRYSETDSVLIRGWSADQPPVMIEGADGGVHAMSELMQGPPQVTGAIADQQAMQDSSFQFELPADVFAGASSYSAVLSDGSPLPEWLAFHADANHGNYYFSGTPANGDVGDLDVQVIAQNALSNTASQTFRLGVGNVNDVPTPGEVIGSVSATEDSGFGFVVPTGAFHDVDAGDSLGFTAAVANGNPLPAWLVFDPATGTFSGTPTNDDVGTLTLSLTATDTSGASATQTFSLDVINTNDAPILAAALNPVQVDAGALFSWSLPAGSFVDADADDVLGYSASLADGSPLPAWLSLDAATGSLSGTPGPGDAGAISLQLTATDSSGETATGALSLTVASIVQEGQLFVGTRQADTLTGTAYDDVFDGRAGVDTLIGQGGDDLYLVADRKDIIVEQAGGGFDTVWADIDTGAGYTLPDQVEALALVGAGDYAGRGNELDNLLLGNRGDNRLDGKAGSDILLGQGGGDTLLGGAGLDALDGGSGRDVLDDGDGAGFLAGGRGDDTLHLGGGADVIAFNRGDGEDHVQGGDGQNDTLSLGGGIRVGDLRLRRTGKDLIVDTGRGDRLCFDDWYRKAASRSIATLQIATDASGTAFDRYDFAALVGKFDAKLAANRRIEAWTPGSEATCCKLGEATGAVAGGSLAASFARSGKLNGIRPEMVAEALAEPLSDATASGDLPDVFLPPTLSPQGGPHDHHHGHHDHGSHGNDHPHQRAGRFGWQDDTGPFLGQKEVEAAWQSWQHAEAGSPSLSAVDYALGWARLHDRLAGRLDEDDGGGAWCDRSGGMRQNGFPLLSGAQGGLVGGTGIGLPGAALKPFEGLQEGFERLRAS